jgi:6-phosphogluconolactonase
MSFVLVTEANTQILFQQAGQLLASRLQQLASQPRIVIGVCGGRSIVGLLQEIKLHSAPFAELWTKIHFFFVDERIVPLDHPDSNYNLLNKNFFTALFDEHLLTPEQLHPFPVDSKEEDRGMKQYSDEFFSCTKAFDIALLSAGEDGHVASLFPHHPAIRSAEPGFLLVEQSPKPPADRMSASKTLLSRAGTAVVIFSGGAKRQAFLNFQNDRLTIEDCPAKLVHAAAETIILSDILPEGSA